MRTGWGLLCYLLSILRRFSGCFGCRGWCFWLWCCGGVELRDAGGERGDWIC